MRAIRASAVFGWIGNRRNEPTYWASLVADHSAALEEFALAARRLSVGAWLRPMAPGKWSPAEVTCHVTEAYRVLRTELAGGTGMRMLGSWLQRWLLRRTMLPRLVAGKAFPPGVRAPRETRPREIEADPAAALATLAAEGQAFTQDLTARAEAGAVRLTHAYFGHLSACEGLQLLIVHTRHHARQLVAGST
jgi:hypothetical protein